MNRPILVLQYPDPRQGRTVALAATRNRKALLAFKEVVLQEARMTVMDWTDDEILQQQDKDELNRLTSLLELVIPDNE